MAKYTEAQAKSFKKYMSKLVNYNLRMTPDEKERLVSAAKAAGQSLNAYILEAIEKRISSGE